MKIEVRLEIPLPKVDFMKVADEAAKVADDIYSYTEFEKALRSLKSEGVTYTEICKVAGIPWRCLYSWRRGLKRPVDPYYFVFVREWARLVQENRVKVEEEYELARKTGKYSVAVDK